MILYNTEKRKEEEFEPIEKGNVSMYTCGPTVYNVPHIGNYRAYITADTLKRALISEGLRVKHVMNITDVDDKTIRDSQKVGENLKDFTQKYTKLFKEDLESLNVLIPDVMPNATDEIEGMIKITESLIEKGYAYKAEDGSVYFEVAKDKNYGKLAKIDMSEQKENALGRIKKDEYEKENAQDFALWKAWTEEDGEVFWDPSLIIGTSTSLGKGRPGWHIECSAMSMRYLGEHFDIHTGGIDLIFPHHENEIAQSECSTGKHFVNFWVHNEWLLVDGKKMSKSLGNQVTLRDVIEKGVSPIAFRLWILMGHYRTLVNFNWDALLGTETALFRLYDLVSDLGDAEGNINEDYMKKIQSHLSNDLDTPKAIALVWEIIKDDNILPEDKRATLFEFDKVLGLELKENSEIKAPDEVLDLVSKRENARMEKDWAKSDEIRAKIESFGFTVKDTSSGPKVKKLR